MAGRSMRKLEFARAELVKQNIDEASTPIDLFEVDIADEAALESLAASTAVLINAVGPYCEHGLRVVKVRVLQATTYESEILLHLKQ
jgi:short subunit dehydrogenase-like uncharacterized protein